MKWKPPGTRRMERNLERIDLFFLPNDKMENKATSSATLRICQSVNPDVYGGQDHLAIQTNPEMGSGIIVADIETTAEAEAYVDLFATAPDLLRIAESAANAFEERISCLKDELKEEFCDEDD